MTHRHEDTSTPDLFADTATLVEPPSNPPPPAAPEAADGSDDGDSILLHESA